MEASRSAIPRQQRLLLALTAAALAVAATLTPGTSWTAPRVDTTAGTAPSLISVLFSAAPGEEEVARAAVEAAGGRVTRNLRIINGYVASVPTTAVGALRAHPALAWLSPDRPVTLSHQGTSAHGATSMVHLAQTVNANKLWQRGITGQGVDVAVIDSGVVPVDGLRAPGKVVNGPDLSFESGHESVQHLDTYGHGTHMAGIIAGRDDVTGPGRNRAREGFSGIAPDARIVNIKVADNSGATDVSQVIAAIDWVVQHGRSNGLNVRVLNLSFGTDGVQDYRLDPLAHAVEQAWHRGIVVVAAAGNEGYGDAQMNNPAYDPYVLAVGATDGRGTVGIHDDVVASWSSRGHANRHPDLVAPGQSVISLRDPGSRIDQENPGARIGSRFFRGSGTSQAAAVVTGAAALLLQQRPELTPDQLKSLLTSTARPLGQPREAEGAGLLDVKRAAKTATPITTQSWPRSLGTGSLELARGSHHVTLDGVPLVGEQSVFLTAWNGYAWATANASGTAWTGGSWTGNSWTGNSWTGGSWTGNSWTGNSWTGNSWTGNSWTGGSWTGNSWTGNSWTGNSWTGNSWTGNSWTGNSWTGNSWTANSWTSAGW